MQRQEDLFKFEASLVYLYSEFQDSQANTLRVYLKQTTEGKKERKKRNYFELCPNECIYL